jgi:hypothetical protein
MQKRGSSSSSSSSRVLGALASRVSSSLSSLRLLSSTPLLPLPSPKTPEKSEKSEKMDRNEPPKRAPAVLPPIAPSFIFVPEYQEHPRTLLRTVRYRAVELERNSSEQKRPVFLLAQSNSRQNWDDLAE